MRIWPARQCWISCSGSSRQAGRQAGRDTCGVGSLGVGGLGVQGGSVVCGCAVWVQGVGGVGVQGVRGGWVVWVCRVGGWVCAVGVQGSLLLCSSNRAPKPQSRQSLKAPSPPPLLPPYCSSAVSPVLDVEAMVGERQGVYWVLVPQVHCRLLHRLIPEPKPLVPAFQVIKRACQPAVKSGQVGHQRGQGRWTSC